MELVAVVWHGFDVSRWKVIWRDPPSPLSSFAPIENKDVFLQKFNIRVDFLQSYYHRIQ